MQHGAAVDAEFSAHSSNVYCEIDGSVPPSVSRRNPLDKPFVTLTTSNKHEPKDNTQATDKSNANKIKGAIRYIKPPESATNFDDGTYLNDHITGKPEKKYLSVSVSTVTGQYDEIPSTVSENTYIDIDILTDASKNDGERYVPQQANTDEKQDFVYAEIDHTK